MKSRHKAVTRRLFPKELTNLTYTGDLSSGPLEENDLSKNLRIFSLKLVFIKQHSKQTTFPRNERFKLKHNRIKYVDVYV
jgi:hypothetical protein